MDRKFQIKIDPPSFEEFLARTRHRLREESNDNAVADHRTAVPSDVYQQFAAYLETAAQLRQEGLHDQAWSALASAIEMASRYSGIDEGLYLARTKTLYEHSVENGRKGADEKKRLNLERTKKTLAAVIELNAQTPFVCEIALKAALQKAGRKADLFPYMTEERYKKLRVESALAAILNKIEKEGGLTAPRHPVKRPRRPDPLEIVSIRTSGPSQEPENE